MSQETMEHLNTNVLIGNTDQRGHAWHYRAGLQAGQPNHYPGPIPVDDVKKRLFDCTAQSRRVAQEAPADLDTMTHLSADGTPVRWVPIPNRQAITRSDNDHTIGIFADGYTPHQYDQWLLGTVANILDDELCVSAPGCSARARSRGSRCPCPSGSPPRRASRSGRTCWPPPASTARSPLRARTTTPRSGSPASPASRPVSTAPSVRRGPTPQPVAAAGR